MLTTYITYTDAQLKYHMNAQAEERRRCHCCGGDGPFIYNEGDSCIQGGLCAYCYACAVNEEGPSIPYEDKDAVPDVPMLPAGEGGGPASTDGEVPGGGGLHRRPRDAPIGGPPPSRVSEDERPFKRQRSGLLGSGQFGGTSFSWQLPVVPEPTIGTAILHEGRGLYLEHGPDGEGGGGLEASESLSSSGEDTGSSGSSGDEGEPFDPEQEEHNQAVWDTWRQTVFDAQVWATVDQAESIIDLFHF